MRISNVTPGLLPIPPNGWGATEKIIWEYHKNFLKLGYDSKILYLDDVKYDSDTIVHIHVANLALIAHERGIPYYFTCHDHHSYLYGKGSICFKENYDAIKYSIKSFVPAKYLVDYFNLPNLEYLSHGVNNEFFKPNNIKNTEHKLLCVANNGFIHDASEDRKGFGFAIEVAKKLNLPITIAGPINNKNFFKNHNCNYEKLNIVYDLNETELIRLYQDHSIFLHPSILEAGHPNLTLLEAMACGLPVIGTFEENNSLPALIKVNRNVDEIVNAVKMTIDNYDSYTSKCKETVHTRSWEHITNILLSHYNLDHSLNIKVNIVKDELIPQKQLKSNSSMKQKLIEIYENTKIIHKEPKEIKNKFLLDLNNRCKIEILGDINKEYNIKFINKKIKELVYETTIGNNMWAQATPTYFIDWNIQVRENDTKSLVYDYNLDLSKKCVKILNESPSLGDLISWVAYIDLFQKTHNCEIDFYTPNKDLFEDEYKNINFYHYNQKLDKIYYASYKIGCFDPQLKSLSPKDYRNQNLQQIAAEILGFDFREIKTKISVKDKSRKLDKKYVCISTSSTAGCKHWQNQTGWQKTVDYLKDLGYEVVVIQKEPLNYMDLKGLNNVIHPETRTIHDAISWIHNCEFFIGLSSGNSWLAWALNKDVVMISGFTKAFNEFDSRFRVINENVCNGCWNNTNYKFDPGDWNWCPVYKNNSKQFECSKTITFEMVKEKIDTLINPTEKLKTGKKFDPFTYKEIFEWNQYEKFVQVNNNDFVVDLGCSMGYFYIKHKNKNINYIGVDGSTDCLSDFIENLDGDESPTLIHSLIDSKKSIQTFASMFHGNKEQKSMSMTFPDFIKLIGRRIDFLKFDIEGYEKTFLDENYELFKSSVDRFTGEFHFSGGHFPRNHGYDVLRKILNDKDLVVKLFSVDAWDITDNFWNNPDYYTEIIISGFVNVKNS